MSEQIERTDIVFESTGGGVTIHGYRWAVPQDVECKGIVQIVHGMAEHIERYEEFACFLASRGFAVVGADKLGHGRSVTDKSHWGELPASGGIGILLGNIRKLRELTQAELGSGLPYFIFGHSMGSFETRAYITRHGEGLAGAVICGTGHVPPATSGAGNTLAKLICKFKGENTRSGLLDNMGVGAYNKGIENPRTPLDWLSFNEKNVDDYIADEACGFMFSAGGYATLTGLTKEVCTPASAVKIPKSLPLLFIAGESDPVGESGKGVQTAVSQARNAGVLDVSCTIYENMRHEILNEDGRARVMEDIASWLDAHI